MVLQPGWWHRMKTNRWKHHPGNSHKILWGRYGCRTKTACLKSTYHRERVSLQLPMNHKILKLLYVTDRQMPMTRGVQSDEDWTDRRSNSLCANQKGFLNLYMSLTLHLAVIEVIIWNWWSWSSVWFDPKSLARCIECIATLHHSPSQSPGGISVGPTLLSNALV